MEELISKGWKIEEGKLSKTFEFNNFKEVVMFFNAVAWEAEKMNHHPDTFITYKKCHINIFTHSEGKITNKDVELGRRIENIFERN